MSNTTTTDPAYLAESRVPQILVGQLLPTALGSFFVAARLYSRALLTKHLSVDDLLVFVAWVFGVAVATTTCLGTLYGMGHHALVQDISLLPHLLQLSFFSRPIYQLALCFTKLAICAFYLRIFQDRRSRLYVYAIIAFIVATAIPIIFTTIFQCIPIEANWNLQRADCSSIDINIYFSTVCNIVADAILIIFVIPRILPLRIARRQKFALLGVVSLGVLVIVAASVRCLLLLKIQVDDFQWTSYNGSTWTAIEIQTGLFCVCAPTLRLLLRRFMPGMMHSTSFGTSRPTDIAAGGIRLTPRLADGKSAPLGSTSTAFWGGHSHDHDRDNGSDDDEGSEKVVYHSIRSQPSANLPGVAAGTNEIIKTVHVRITGTSTNNSDSSGPAADVEKSVTRSEHV